MRVLLLVLPALMVLCCCNRATGVDQEVSGVKAVAHDESLDAPVSDSTRIEYMSREMEDLIDEYETNDNPRAFERAMALNDSLSRIDTTQQGRFYVTLTRSQLLAHAGRMREAMRLQESILDKDPNNFVRLQFFAGKFMMEGKADSSRYYAEKALAVCDRVLKDSVDNPDAIDHALANKMTIYHILNDRARAREVSEALARRHKGNLSYQLTDEEFNAEFNMARENLNRSASAWRNDTEKWNNTYISLNDCMIVM